MTVEVAAARAMTTHYEIQVEGVHAVDLSLSVLRDVADLLVEGSSRAARLAAEGRSTARGNAPLWLGEASDVRLVGLREGSLVLDVRARPLSELAPTVFPAGTSETAFDLLLSAIDDALQGRRDSERLDSGMLQTLGKTRALFGRGATRLRVRREDGRSLEFSGAAVETFQKLAIETPAPATARVVGVLDSLTMSTRTAVLRLDDGAALKVNLGAALELEQLKELLGLEVVLEGIVAFHPSGGAQRIEIDHVARATARDLLWRRAPRGELSTSQLSLASDGLAGFFGTWPGDEDDDQIFAALRELA